jgi:hypothetical protein
MVKNCGACGSMAPPTTVEIINPLLGRLKSIALGPGQQAAWPADRLPGNRPDNRYDWLSSPAR